MNLKSLNKKLVIFEHDEENETVHICFAKFKAKKIVSQEEAILEDLELYQVVKDLLVKWARKEVI